MKSSIALGAMISCLRFSYLDCIVDGPYMSENTTVGIVAQPEGKPFVLLSGVKCY